MQFKSLFLFKLNNPGLLDPGQLPYFVPTEPTQAVSIGFVPPRGALELITEEVPGTQDDLLRVRIERRSVPSEAIKRKVEEAAKLIEQETGRKPGKKHRKELAEQAWFELAPKAFVRTQHVNVWIARSLGLLVVDCNSQSLADDVVTVLVRSIPGIELGVLQTHLTPVTLMDGWLRDSLGIEAFQLGRNALLKSNEPLRASRFKNIAMESGQIGQALSDGLLPAELELEWRERVQFTLTDSMRMKRVKLLDLALSNKKECASDFDADVALQTGELGGLIKELIDAMGGELEVGK